MVHLWVLVHHGPRMQQMMPSELSVNLSVGLYVWWDPPAKGLRTSFHTLLPSPPKDISKSVDLLGMKQI
jgi:hypothetical protein